MKRSVNFRGQGPADGGLLGKVGLALRELDAARLRIQELETELERLRHHFAAAAPEHNLLELLDLYEEREEAANNDRANAEEFAGQLQNERDELRRELGQTREALRSVTSAAENLMSWDWQRLLFDCPESQDAKDDASVLEGRLTGARSILDGRGRAITTLAGEDRGAT